MSIMSTLYFVRGTHEEIAMKQSLHPTKLHMFRHVQIGATRNAAQ